MVTFVIPSPKSQFLDKETGLISRDWFIYLSNLLNAIGNGITGTTTQVLHGGGAGFGQVALSQDVTGVLPGVYGGTGVSNALKSITLGGNLSLGSAVTFTGAFSAVITVTGSTTVTIPTSGTLAALSDIGTLGFQNSNNVNISGGTVSNVTVKAVQLITTSTISINSSASVGGVTASFVAINKPGTSTQGPATWIIATIDGTQRTWPVWPV